MSERRTEYLPLSEIQGAIINPRRHDLDSLRASIDSHGFADSPIRDDRTGRLVAGHGRIEDLRARQAKGEALPDGLKLREDGEWLVPVQVGWSSKDDASATSFLLGSNKIVENSEWVKDEVAALVAALEENDPALVLAAGFSDEAIYDAMKDADDDRSLTVDDGSDYETVTFRLPPDVALLLRAAVDMYSGPESEKVRQLAEAASAGPPPPF